MFPSFTAADLKGKCYTYLWLRVDGTPYYAGKGTGDRCFRPHRNLRNPHPPPVDRIIVQEFEHDSEASDAEQFLISFYGRKDLRTGVLRNITDGGEGELGHRGAFLGKKFSEDHKKKISESLKGHAVSEETRRKFRAAMKRRVFGPRTEEIKLKMSQGRRGIPVSPETKAKLSAGWDSVRKAELARANKERVWSQEMRDKLAAFRRKAK